MIQFSKPVFSLIGSVKILSATILLFMVVGSCGERIPEQFDQPAGLSESHPHYGIEGLLLGSRFSSLEDLKQCVVINYYNRNASMKGWGIVKPTVILQHSTLDTSVISILAGGVDQDDFRDARAGNFWDKVVLGVYSPYTALNRADLMRIFYLSRRRHHQFGASDVAFYDLAERMACNIDQDEYDKLFPRDTTEKGFINTFNHITAQAMMTSLFSEELADFIADVHERLRPYLITGEFTSEQLNDLEEGPLDNYVDIVNNEWGQELGKVLSAKYEIDNETVWTYELLSNYLNDIQDYYSSSLGLKFIPFSPDDYLVIRFTDKLNIVLGELPKFEKKEK